MNLKALLPSQEREQLMLSGAAQLRQWLMDTLRVGLLKMDLQAALEELSIRMVDAKLGSIARRLRLIAELDPAQPEWSDTVMHELSLLYALAHSMLHSGEQDTLRRLALYGHAGLNFRKSDLLKLPGVEDLWLIMSHHITQHDNLRSRSCWAIGRQSHRIALLLDYAFGRSRFESTLKVGSHYRMRLHFYPSLFPLRAVHGDLKEMSILVESLPGYDDFERFMLQYARAVARDPWLRTFPASLQKVTLKLDDSSPSIIDEGGWELSAGNDLETLWQLMSITGGSPIHTFGSYNGSKIMIYSYLEDGAIHPLD